ncbi:MAG: methionine--tRNA ligase subunit beta, partial [Chitinophagaceae bacterium]
GKFGNFVNRSFVLMHKLCAGKVPAFHKEIADAEDDQMMKAIAATRAAVETNIEGYKFRDALFEVIMLSDAANKYMQKKEPWIVAKQVDGAGKILAEAQQKIDNCLHVCLQTTANLAILINPFLPFAAKKMCHMMKVVDKMLEWENAGKTNLLSVGYSLRAPELLFRKIDDTEVAEQVEKLKSKSESLKQAAKDQHMEETKAATPARAVKDEIQFDDFAKIDLKVGTIVSAEKVEKADKLLKLQVDLGFETRTIVSGIALHFDPAAIVGKQVTVVTNLAPRKMRGIESNGMILMAEDAAGKLKFVNPDEAVENGSGVS